MSSRVRRVITRRRRTWTMRQPDIILLFVSGGVVPCLGLGRTHWSTYSKQREDCLSDWFLIGFPLLPLRLLSYWSTPLFSFYVFGNRNDRAVLGDESVKRGFYDCQAAGVRTRKRAPNRKGERATDGPRGPPAGLVPRTEKAAEDGREEQSRRSRACSGAGDDVFSPWRLVSR